MVGMGYVLCGISHRRIVMSSLLKEYDTQLDSKKRLTVRGSRYKYYHVEEFEDGHLELQPRVLIAPFEVSEKTLEMIDASVANMKAGRTGAPVDLSKYPEIN